MNAPYDAVIVGAGAAGLFCAIAAASRGCKVCVVDLADIPARKMRVCGGGYGNFSNRDLDPKRDYYSRNPHFAVSALRRFTTEHILRMLDTFGFDYELRGDCYFLTVKMTEFVHALHEEAALLGVDFRFNTRIAAIGCDDGVFTLSSRNGDTLQARKCVIATGSSAYPQLGGNTSGLDFATQFGHKIEPFRSGLAPIRFPPSLIRFGELAGIAFEDIALTVNRKIFRGSLVFRPDGIGGIAVFKAASEWQWAGGEISIDWLPDVDLRQNLEAARAQNGTQSVAKWLGGLLPKRLAAALVTIDKPLAQLTKPEIETVVQIVKDWRLMPSGVGDAKEAEVMLGGVLTDDVSSKTFESKLVPGLYFCGELLDVTGQLGGYNLHWAFASGHVAGENI